MLENVGDDRREHPDRAVERRPIEPFDPAPRLFSLELYRPDAEDGERRSGEEPEADGGDGECPASHARSIDERDVRGVTRL